jgi:DNA-binding NtrC family response regulator
VNQNGHYKPSVMIVDDELMVTSSIQAFLQMETDYEIHSFNDPGEAVRYAANQRVDVVVSDYLMPEMTGIDLLGQVKELQPEASRVLLTGHADKQSAIDAINRVGLYQYLEKPWDNPQLLLVIQSGVERARLFRDLHSKIGELDSAHSSLKTVQKQLVQAFL